MNIERHSMRYKVPSSTPIKASKATITSCKDINHICVKVRQRNLNNNGIHLYPSCLMAIYIKRRNVEVFFVGLNPTGDKALEKAITLYHGQKMCAYK